MAMSKKHDYKHLSTKRCECCGNFIKQNLIDRKENARFDYVCYQYLIKGIKVKYRILQDQKTKQPYRKTINLYRIIEQRRRANTSRFKSNIKLN